MLSRIGIDFDNTIICYDDVFNTVGVENGLVPKSLPVGKGFVRDYLREQGQEHEWIWLQGVVYGTRLADARLYEGVKRFLGYCKDNDIQCSIVSHKTIFPYSGDDYNLHQSAREWIRLQALNVPTYFELTKEDKINRINRLGCSVFIDDLPEFLNLPGFPEKMEKILFDPLGKNTVFSRQFHYSVSWNDIFLYIKNLVENECIS